MLIPIEINAFHKSLQKKKRNKNCQSQMKYSVQITLPMFMYIAEVPNRNRKFKSNLKLIQCPNYRKLFWNIVLNSKIELKGHRKIIKIANDVYIQFDSFAVIAVVIIVMPIMLMHIYDLWLVSPALDTMILSLSSIWIYLLCEFNSFELYFLFTKNKIKVKKKKKLFVKQLFRALPH